MSRGENPNKTSKEKAVKEIQALMQKTLSISPESAAVFRRYHKQVIKPLHKLFESHGLSPEDPDISPEIARKITELMHKNWHSQTTLYWQKEDPAYRQFEIFFINLPRILQPKDIPPTDRDIWE